MWVDRRQVTLHIDTHTPFLREASKMQVPLALTSLLYQDSMKDLVLVVILCKGWREAKSKRYLWCLLVHHLLSSTTILRWANTECIDSLTQIQRKRTQIQMKFTYCSTFSPVPFKCSLLAIWMLQYRSKDKNKEASCCRKNTQGKPSLVPPIKIHKTKAEYLKDNLNIAII